MKVKQLLISIASVVTFALVAVVVATNQNTQTLPSFADPAYKEETLNAAKLATCTFSAYTFDKKNKSRKFKYEMSGGKFIEGAILYGGAGDGSDYQFVGDNLSQPFGMDNTTGGWQYPNIFIFFNAHGLTRVDFYFNAQLNKSTEPGTTVVYNYWIKLTDKCANGLYTELDKQTYSKIKQTVAENDFYKDGTTGGSDELKDTNPKSEHPYRPNQYAGTINAAVLQIEAFKVPANTKFSITLTSIVLRYTC